MTLFQRFDRPGPRRPWRIPGALLLALSVAGPSAGPVASQVADPVAARTTAPEQRFFDWTRVPFPTAEYARRREAVLDGLGPGGGVLMVTSAHGLSHGETFRQSDDFEYLTGLELPGSVLLLDLATRRPTLLVPARDPRFEAPGRPNDFPGRPLLGDPELARRSGIRDIRDVAQLDLALREWERLGVAVRVNAGRPGRLRPVVPSLIPDWDPALLSLYHIQTTYPRLELQNAFEALARARMIKSPVEIEALRRAARATASAIRTAAARVRDRVTERELEAEFTGACLRNGAQRVAFHPIIKSGPNSLWPWRILAAHYDRRNRAMHDGEIVIFDVGCEVDHYVSDVGRTFPVSGRFTAEQRRALVMEIGVADAIIAAVRPGVTLAELQAVANAAIPPGERPYMQTGLFFGHHIGLSTGDPALPDVPLAPGMVFTVEPWYYNHDTGIAVFTEDVVLVTAGGAELLTSGLPREPDELERLVRP